MTAIELSPTRKDASFKRDAAEARIKSATTAMAK